MVCTRQPGRPEAQFAHAAEHESAFWGFPESRDPVFGPYIAWVVALCSIHIEGASCFRIPFAAEVYTQDLCACLS